VDGLEFTHDLIVEREGVFKECVEAIRMAKILGYQCATNTTVYKETDVQEIEDMFKFLSSLNVDGHTISPGYDYDAAKKDMVKRLGKDPKQFFLTREMTRQKFAKVLEWGKAFTIFGTPGYLEFLLNQFAENPHLGVAGTPFVENSQKPGAHTYAHQFAQLEHVSGACQLFRRECFESVGGYIPIKGGAIDWIAVTTARMNGWQTRTFTEMTCFHHRKLGTGNDSPLMVKFRYGQKAYYVGGHPLWELLRGVFQMRQKPWIIGGLYFELGFLWAMITRMSRPVSPELMAFHRSEQMNRLRGLGARLTGRARA
jgi:GT2 family glycosyltransferase